MKEKKPADFDIDHKELLESTGDVIYTLDLEGRVTYYNAKGGAALGLGPREGIGLHLTDVLTPESAKVALEHFRAGIEGWETSPYFEVEAIHRKNGSTVPAGTSA